MKPITSKFNMNDLSQYQQRKICQCESLCEHGYTITTYNDGMMLCANDAKDFHYDLLKNMDGVGYTRWTKDDEQYLINIYQSKGAYYGINRDIAKKIGKTPIAVHNKITQFKKRGLI